MVRIICAAVLLLTLACGAFAQEPVASVATTTSGAVASTTTSGAVASTTTSGPVASIKTSDGKTFNNVTVLKVKGDKVLLTCSEGGALVALDTLSDETRKALGLRTRDEQAAYEAEQMKKGLVKVGDDWITPKEKKRREEKTAADLKAQKDALAAKPKLEVLDFGWAYDQYGSRVIRGRLRNNTDQEYDQVYLSFNLYDAAGTQIGYTNALLPNLEAKAIWKFEASVTDDNATKVKLKECNGSPKEK